MADPVQNTTPAEALAALLNGPPTSLRTRIQEAVYWPNEGGYGGGTVCADMTGAARKVAETARLGYGADSPRPKGMTERHRIHVTRTTVETWEVPIELCDALRQVQKK